MKVESTEGDWLQEKVSPMAALKRFISYGSFLGSVML